VECDAVIVVTQCKSWHDDAIVAQRQYSSADSRCLLPGDAMQCWIKI